MISMKSVAKTFGSAQVLSDVTFSVCRGEIFGLLGPSGAGKTTIINILTRQLDADGGEHNVHVQPHEMGLMLEEDGLFPRLGCVANLNVFADVYKIPRSHSRDALAKVGLLDSAKKAVLQLSTGMRRRLQLARAILHSPKVLFLDEPTNGLDPTTAQGIHALIRSLQSDGATIFMTTHNMEEAVELCDNVVLLDCGHIVEQGSPAEICTRHNSFKTVPDLAAVFIKLTGGQNNEGI